MSNQSIFETLRANGEETLSAALPDEATCCGERLVIDDVDCNDLGTLGELLRSGASVASPRFMATIVDEADAFVGLLRRDDGGHPPRPWASPGGSDMVGMAVQPVANPGSDCEQVAEGLVAPDGRGCRQRAGATRRRGWEPRDRSPGRSIRRAAPSRRSSRSCNEKWALRARPGSRKTGGRCSSIQSGDCDRAMPAIPMPRYPCKSGKLCRRRNVEEQNRRHAREGQHFHDRRGAGEVVAIEADKETVWKALAGGAHAA